MKIPHIDHAFENIENACKDRLSKLYPVNIPESVSSRYTKELAYLKSSDYIDDFEIFRRLSEESVRCSAIITMRGTVTGSFIYYLLGNNCFSPLPAHYYCPVCGHYEQVQTHLFGIDLPKKACPNCGKEVFADGFNIPLESIWGNDGQKTVSFDYNVSAEFMPFARRVLVSLYPDNNIVPWGMFQFDSATSSDNDVVGVGLAGYAVIPGENTIQDYPDLLSCLENGDPCVTGGGWELEKSFLKPIRLFPLGYMDSLIQLQRATGIYANELSNIELREITWSNIFNTTVLDSTTGNLFHELKPKTFWEMVSILSSSHSTFSWEKDGCKDLYDYTTMTSSDAFTRFPCFTREDFFDFLLEEGFERSFAFDVSEQIRKGYANSSKFSEEFNSLPIPNAIKEVARNYLYLFPRAHCVEYMLIYARLAHYAKIDSRAFSKIVFSRKK